MSLPQLENTSHKPEGAVRPTDGPLSLIHGEDFKILGKSREARAAATKMFSEGDNPLLPKLEPPCETDGVKYAANGRGPRIMNDATPDSLLQAARNREGQQVWKGTPFKNQVDDGLVACATALGQILNEGGERVKPSPLAVALKNNLIAAGRTVRPLSEAQPGDVIYGTKVGRSAAKGDGASHIALVDSVQNGKIMVWDNFGKAGGVWSRRPLEESFDPNRYDYSRLVALKRNRNR